jgi:hypothetical protein
MSFSIAIDPEKRNAYSRIYGLLVAINALEDYISNGYSGEEIESQVQVLVMELEGVLQEVHFDLDMVKEFVSAVDLRCRFAMGRISGQFV